MSEELLPEVPVPSDPAPEVIDAEPVEDFEPLPFEDHPEDDADA